MARAIGAAAHGGTIVVAGLVGLFFWRDRDGAMRPDEESRRSTPIIMTDQPNYSRDALETLLRDLDENPRSGHNHLAHSMAIG